MKEGLSLCDFFVRRFKGNLGIHLMANGYYAYTYDATTQELK
jgi:hypothetical protein